MSKTADEQLTEDMGGFWNDPLGFVLYSYQWNTGELFGYRGPDSWQRGFLLEWGQEITARKFDGINAVLPVLMSTVSGHGIGKSAMAAWICDFIPSTRPFSKGIVTANTAPQLETKTWAEVAKWTKRCITGHWFKVTTGRGAMKKVHKDFPESWRIDAMTWSEESPESFAGQHAANSTPWYLFDEASGIPKNIYETSQGGLTDGEPMMFLFGNGTRNSGYFFDTHHSDRAKWKTFNVDSRTSSITNKALLDQWIEKYGLDSDYVRVKILGQFPNQSTAQFVPSDTVREARKREPKFNHTDPLILGVDVGRFGSDPTVFTFRRGRDAKSIPVEEHMKMDTMWTAGRIVELNNEYGPDAIFIDGNGLGGGVVDRCRQLNVDVIEVNSSFKPTNRDYRSKGDEIWGDTRDWIAEGGAIPDNEQLETELTTREYFFDKQNRISLESKDDLKSRGLSSPNYADSLALTFSWPVGPRDPNKAAKQHMKLLKTTNDEWDFNPYAEYENA